MFVLVRIYFSVIILKRTFICRLLSLICKSVLIYCTLEEEEVKRKSCVKWSSLHIEDNVVLLPKVKRLFPSSLKRILWKTCRYNFIFLVLEKLNRIWHNKFEMKFFARSETAFEKCPMNSNSAFLLLLPLTYEADGEMSWRKRVSFNKRNEECVTRRWVLAPA